jgi:hypothetical protein
MTDTKRTTTEEARRVGDAIVPPTVTHVFAGSPALIAQLDAED